MTGDTEYWGWSTATVTRSMLRNRTTSIPVVEMVPTEGRRPIAEWKPRRR
jgi:hypothetical protein